MAAPKGLHALARLHGIQTAYRSASGERVGASPEGILAALRALRVPVDDAEVTELLEHRRRELAGRVLEPVSVAWREERDGGARVKGHIRVRLPARDRDEPLRFRAGLETGGERRWTVAASSVEEVEEKEVDGAAFLDLRVPVPDLPEGYHDLSLELGKGRWDALLLVAPERATPWDAVTGGSAWGVFIPLYALWEREGTLPHFGLLDRLAERVAGLGGSVVGTLPVLAAFLDRPYEPSPYAPASRLFWNEAYVDPAAAPGGDALDDDARAVLSGRAPPADGADPRWFDPGAALRAKRPALEALARAFFAGDPDAELAAFLARNPLAEDYARFRAITERRGPWPTWPERLRARDVRDGDYDDEVARYHVYVQWLAERQLAAVTERARSRGVSLYLDLPLGVHPDGYDVWKDRALFASGASAGAPPDPLAAEGQDWGFPPMHPEASRMDRHRYFVACIRKHLRFARVLRIDHVMQLQRMFWVPGGDATRGVYVRYPAEELYAVLSLESRRAGAVIVGEDLGTVPAGVRRGMRRHGLYGMYVAQFELREEAKAGEAAEALVPGPVRAGAVASIGTHDTPTFAGWWSGRDAEIRRASGAMTEEQAREELASRAEMRDKLQRGLLGSAENAGAAEAARTRDVEVEVEVADPEAAHRVLAALHRHMARSAAGLVLATAEDLWLEPEPQNVPGTTSETNWRRRSARPLDALDAGEAGALLRELDEVRREAE